MVCTLRSEIVAPILCRFRIHGKNNPFPKDLKLMQQHLTAILLPTVATLPLQQSGRARRPLWLVSNQISRSEDKPPIGIDTYDSARRTHRIFQTDSHTTIGKVYAQDIRVPGIGGIV